MGNIQGFIASARESTSVTKKRTLEILKEWNTRNPKNKVKLKDVETYRELIVKIAKIRIKRERCRPLKKYELIQRCQKTMIKMKRIRRAENQPLDLVEAFWEKQERRLTDPAGVLCEHLQNSFGSPSHGGYSIRHTTNSASDVWTEEEHQGRYSSRCTFQKISRDIRVTTNLIRYIKIEQPLKELCVVRATLFRRIGAIKIYDCQWITKGQGYGNFSIKTGKIILNGEVTYHVGKKSLKAAIRALRRKLLAESAMGDLRDLSGVSISNLSMVVDKIIQGEITDFDNVKITRQTSFRAGNCKPGTHEFIEANALDETLALTIAEYRNCSPLQYRNEYRAAILQGIKEAYSRGKLPLAKIQSALNQAGLSI